MSGRGARGRKAIVKNIEKTEKKQAAKQYSHDIRSTTSSSGWSLGSSSTLQRPSSSQTLTRTPSFSTTIRSQGSSSNSRNASQSRNEQHRPKTAAAKIKPDERYQNRAGKETVAPRGRGGGVPSKSTPANRVGQPSQMSDRTTQSTSDVSQSRRTSGMMFWYGGDKSPVPYRGFDNDHDMRMSSGDCNVYFSEEVDDEDPKPALRVHVKLLERAGSLFLNNLLQYGEVYRVDELTPPPTPGAPLTRSNLGYLAEETETPASFSSDNGSSISQYPRNYANNSLRPSGSRTSNHQAMRGMNEATPPMSAAASDKASSAGMYGQEAEITHEIWFRAPANITSSFEKHLYHLAVRNFLALLYTLPVVGRDVFEMFSGLLGVMDSFYELNEGDPRRRGNVQRIIEYIRQRGLDDVRGNSRAALGLLAWCELPHVRWLEGYKEAFIHSVGIMNSNMQDYPEFKRLSLTTRHNLENAYNQLQLKVLDAERLLENWNFSDIWTTMGISESHAAYKSYDLFRKFLVDYYSNDCGAWPPERSTNSGRWLNRSVVTRLQEDFGAMWEYLVDRNIYWQANETRHTRKWEIMPYKNHSGESFNADMPGLPITDMLGSFDNRNMHERLPGPYPLLPRSTHIPAPKQKEKKSFFGGLRGKAKSAAVRDQKEQFEIAIAFSGATNNNKPGLTFESNAFVDAFIRYEKTVDLPTDMSWAEARMGRWILLYGIIQTISKLSVDTIGVRYRDRVNYLLCLDIPDGFRPWTGAPAISLRAPQKRSYCWEAKDRWKHAASAESPKELDASGSSNVDSGDALSELDGSPPFQYAPTDISLGTTVRLEQERGSTPVMRNHPPLPPDYPANGMSLAQTIRLEHERSMNSNIPMDHRERAMSPTMRMESVRNQYLQALAQQQQQQQQQSQNTRYQQPPRYESMQSFHQPALPMRSPKRMEKSGRGGAYFDGDDIVSSYI